jgi:hypothetical protein
MRIGKALLLITIIIYIIFLVIEYKDYDFVESDLENNINYELSEITYPEEVDYIVLDEYNKGRVRFYSGKVFNKGNRGPFIYGYRKHWLLPRYDNATYLLRHSHTKISESGPQLETLMFKYTAYQEDDNLTLKVHRTINYKTILQYCFIVISIIVGSHYRKKKLVKD